MTELADSDRRMFDLSQQVLRTDASGMPLEWIDYRDAVRLYHTDQVAYVCGAPLFKVHGGINSRSGIRSVIEVNSIIATTGHQSGVSANRHGQPHVTLMLLDGQGQVRTVLNGLRDSDVLLEAFQRHVDRYAAR